MKAVAIHLSKDHICLIAVKIQMLDINLGVSNDYIEKVESYGTQDTISTVRI